MSLNYQVNSKGLFCPNCGFVTQVWRARYRSKEFEGVSYEFFTISVVNPLLFPNPTEAGYDLLTYHPKNIY